jgi:hypothetical protein
MPAEALYAVGNAADGTGYSFLSAAASACGKLRVLLFLRRA